MSLRKDVVMGTLRKEAVRIGSLSRANSVLSERNQSIVVEVIEFKDEKIPIGTPDILKRHYESLDYDQCENDLLVNEAQLKGYPWEIRRKVLRWFICLLIGVGTGLVAVAVNISIQVLSNYKYTKLKEYLDVCWEVDCMWKPTLVWWTFNIIVVIPGTLLVTYVEPVAIGAGIPQVKAYLNGIKVKHCVRFRTMLVKTIGVISTVVGGLASGKEGPMIHSGAVVAAQISQGMLTKSVKLDSFAKFRNDREKRDFVSGGAAAGVAAAFGAPIGGVLFSLEEGASFWNQGLTWRIFFSSTLSAFTLNACMSWYEGHPGNMSYDGILNFGKFEDLNYMLPELVIFVIMGAIGGCLGAFFNCCSLKLTIFRMRYIRKKWMKVVEVILMSVITASVALIMMFAISHCVTLGDNPTLYPIQMHCKDGEYNTMATLWFQLPETTVQTFFHDVDKTHSILSLIPFVLAYYIVSIFTYGMNVSIGVFIPSLLVGAAWGRMIGILLEEYFPYTLVLNNPSKFALIGAAAQLGGVVRMTISLTVILIEATGSIIFGLPLMVTLFTAKWVGDCFNESIYDVHTHLMGLPSIAWEPPPLSFTMYAKSFMNSPVTTLQPTESVRKIVKILRGKTYNGFPIVDTAGNDRDLFGRLRGMISRSQLMVLLHNKIYNLTTDGWDNSVINMKMFSDAYPIFPKIEDLALTEEEMNRYIDLRPFMNPSPYCVQMSSSLTRVFRLFRALGLRHLIVINEDNEVVGMVTRKDIAKFRFWKHFVSCGVKELKIV